MSILSEQHSRVLKRDAEIAKFLGIEKPETVFYQQAVNREEKIKEKDLMPKYIKDIEIEELYQKIVFALTETKHRKGKENEELKPTYMNSENQSEQKIEADYTRQNSKTRKSKEVLQHQAKEKHKRENCEQKKKVRPSKVVQTTEIKSNNIKEDSPSSYISKKKGKKNEQ
ncbi:16893_t:CDS:2 [Gigaspora margarita]|uniref:16893_t:CDS:1 n=1 Tax=Gigaspora margarita TaxID=4874 RepID=A0ABN7WB45_GIGMA|nr:16893_t:CDS:2 [Gigaspora margarita]